MTTHMITEAGSRIPAELAAQVAPLSRPLIAHAFAQRWEASAARVPVYSREEAAERFHHIWQDYLADVRKARARLVEEIDAQVQIDNTLTPRQKQLGGTWLRHELARKSHELASVKQSALSFDTMTRLIEGHLLRRDAWGVYDWQSVAALSICRRVDQVRERNWLPERVSEDEPWWWCWSQEGPGAERVPSPYPIIPINLPSSTLLYTRWAGASWSDAAWLKIDLLGAITFAGLIYDVRTGSSTMRLEDLEIWEQGISKQPLPPLATSDEDDLDQEAGLDLSIGLVDGLSALGKYRESSGLIQAPITHVPGIRGGKGHATLQLHEGKVRSCWVRDQKGRTHPIEQSALERLDKKYGPFPWIFHHFSEAMLLRNLQYQHFFREQATALLQRLSGTIFKAQFDEL